MKATIWLLALVLAGTVWAADEANLIVNGSFEVTNTGLVGYPYFKEPATNTLYKAMNMIPAGNKGITGWVVEKGNVDWIGEWGTSDGVACIDLNGDRPGAISQTFDTQPGELYELKFDLSANPDQTNRISRIKVTVADKTETYSIDRATFKKGQKITYNDLGCMTVSFKFRAKDAKTKLTFESLEDTGKAFIGGYMRNGYIYTKAIENSTPVVGLLAGPVIDNVRVRKAVDSLSISAKAVPASSSSKIWFSESQSAKRDLPVEESEK